MVAPGPLSKVGEHVLKSGFVASGHNESPRVHARIRPPEDELDPEFDEPVIANCHPWRQLGVVEDRIKRIVADVSGHAVAVLVSNRDLRDYGIDSSRALEVLAECEDVFGLEFSEEAIPRLRTIADIASYVSGRAEV